MQIPIVNDMDCEQEEQFFGNLAIPAAAMGLGLRVGPKDTATFSIQNDDSKWMHNTVYWMPQTAYNSIQFRGTDS